MKIRRLAVFLFLACAAAQIHAEYSRWTLFGGLNLVWNSDGDGITVIPGMLDNGDPGGLTSAPSPIAPFFGGEYRYPLKTRDLFFSPSLSFYSLQYLWDNDRPLPAEIENRTAYVPSIFMDFPFLWSREYGRFLLSAGGGPGILARYGFLDSGVDPEEKNPGDEYNAGDQVKHINAFFWDSARWLYPSIQAGAKYRLETGWGGGFTLRIAYPLANFWSTPTVPLYDSIMYMLSVTITPPARTVAPAAAAEPVTDPQTGTTPSP